MKKIITLLFFVVIVFLIVLNTYSNTKSHTANSQKNEVTPHKQVKTIVSEGSNNSSDCTDSFYVCERAPLLSGDTFAYSDYIWAKKGQVIEFGGAATGATNIGFWVESEDVSFTSDIDLVSNNGKDNSTLLAPFDGFYRVIIQNGGKNNNGSGYAYIKDTWVEKN